MIIIKTIDEQILSNISFKINTCLEFACALKAIAKKEQLFDLAREMNFNINKSDEKLVNEIEKGISSYIRRELDYFFSICGIDVLVAAYVADFENIDSVPKFLQVFEKASTTILFRYLGGVFLASEVPALNVQWDKIYEDLNAMKSYVGSLKVENVEAHKKLLECFENAEETKDRLYFLFKQFYQRSYSNIENTVLEEIKNAEHQYNKILKANPQDFAERYFFNYFKIQDNTWEYKLNIHLSLFLNIYFWNINLHDYKQKAGWVILGLRTYEFYFQKEASDRVDRFLKVLSDKRRVDIIKMLSFKPYYGYEIAAKLQLTPATVNYHINLLMDAGILSFDREENKVYYTLNKDKIKQLLNDTSIMLINEPLQ